MSAKKFWVWDPSKPEQAVLIAAPTGMRAIEIVYAAIARSAASPAMAASLCAHEESKGKPPAKAAKVDVLAVMEKAVVAHGDVLAVAHRVEHPTIEDLKAVRAAVAELVEAAKAMTARFDGVSDANLAAAASGRIIIPRLSGIDVQALIAARAALARVGVEPPPAPWSPECFEALKRERGAS